MYLIIGHASRLFTQYFDANDIQYYTIKDDKKHPLPSPNSVSVNFNDREAVFRAAAALPQRPTAIFSIYEQYVPIAAEINARLGFTEALSLQAAQASTDKVSMRQAFTHAPEVISPPFILAETEDQIIAFAESNGFPVMLKPTNLSKSLLITRCDTKDDLLQAWRKAQVEAPRLYAQFTNELRPRFILEACMTGSVHTVMGFADKHGDVIVAKEIVDNITAKEAGFDDSFIFSRTIPSELDAENQAAILRCAELGIKALGLRSCPAHVELILTPQGARIIEIGARVGGYRTVMYREASGIDVVEANIRAYSGDLPDLTVTKHAFYRAIELFPTQEGALSEVTNFSSAATLPSILSARIKSTPGTVVGKASDGFKATAVIELSSDSETQIAQDYSYIQQHVAVKTV